MSKQELSKAMHVLKTDPAGVVVLCATMVKMHWPLAFSVDAKGECWEVTCPAHLRLAVEDVLLQCAAADAESAVERAGGILLDEPAPDPGVCEVAGLVGALPTEPVAPADRGKDTVGARIAWPKTDGEEPVQ